MFKKSPKKVPSETHLVLEVRVNESAPYFIKCGQRGRKKIVIKWDFYMDDRMTGCDGIDEAKHIETKIKY